MKRSLLQTRKRVYSTTKHILGIETSCDDTCAAVLDRNGKVLSNVVSSQWDLIAEWKGIVPKLAAREHHANLPKVVEKALEDSTLKGMEDISHIAVTTGPGLALCLDAGVKYAKKLAIEHDIRLIAVNHLEGHALSPFLTEPDLTFPYLVLLVSGGHCSLVVAEALGKYVELGSTLDDSVGEAFDKVARVLGLLENASSNIHGGKVLENAALKGDKYAFAFTEPMLKRKDCDFSFCGLKTATRYQLKKLGNVSEKSKIDIAASFQHVVMKHLIRRTSRAISICKKEYGAAIHQLVVCGGVASNASVRLELGKAAQQQGFQLVLPPPMYCTDNAAMIGYVGLQKAMHDMHISPSTIDFQARWPLAAL